MAWCNAWLNGDEALVSRLSFGESDLLRQVPEAERWDFVVGCIPQVLRGEGLPEEVAQADEQALYDLSNYCAMQNVYEDHFGLGLIARLLDEVPERLAPDGRLLLNLAGRPGRAIIERMFTRRGFTTRVRVARRVRQAADTDIRPLVALEQRTRREFEFFMEAHSPEPLRAATALGLARRRATPSGTRWRCGRRGSPCLARRSRCAPPCAPWASPDCWRSWTWARRRRSSSASWPRWPSGWPTSPFLPYAHEAGDASFAPTGGALPGALLRAAARGGGNLRRARAGAGRVLAAAGHVRRGGRVLVSRNLHAALRAGAGEGGRARHGDAQHAGGDPPAARRLRREGGAADGGARASAPTWRCCATSSPRPRGAASWVVLDESAFFNITGEVEPRTLFEFLARERSTAQPGRAVRADQERGVPGLELTLLLPVPERLRG